MAYNFTAEWVKGSKNDAPDALSRNPVCDPEPMDTLAELDTNDHTAMSLAEIRALHAQTPESLRLQDLRRHAGEDMEYQQLRTFIINGFPDHRSQLPEPCKRYWHIREHLSIDDNLIVYGCRPLIPSRMCQLTLAQLHESHQGIVRTKQ